MTGMTRNRDFMGLDADSDKSNSLAEAFKLSPPPLAQFNANYTACAYPTGNLRQRELQFSQGDTWTGIQLSAAAAVSYFLKSTWYEGTLADYQILSNCIGALVGADVGLDLLLQVFQEGSGFAPAISEEEDPSRQITITDTGVFECVPVTTIAIFGIQVCWDQASGADAGQFVEITFGPSFGAALGGYSVCYAAFTATSKL
ncbi:expressed unknown protein [Seminavis robusta]|uniref:Uncharacterized protein n=1 Tax=Seminavis robusta TaxID=568900 RepID=A0A9N8HC95_9STRA|nr:expressed unknown protein [Seminavis robusta]|eukprot:Sro398_g134640.1 n/a (201) ;mRNA; f:20496-21192